MLRKLMLTTAVLALTAGGAFAQAQTTPTQPAPVQDAAPVQQPPVVKPLTDGTGQLASNLIGESVYNGIEETAVKLGDVSDIVVDANGNASKLIVGVGGFLGIGAKDVAIDYKTAEMAERAGDAWLIVRMSKEELEAAPAFDRTAFAPAMQASTAAPEQPTTDAQETAAIDKSTLTPVPNAVVTPAALAGTVVFGANDERIGEVGEVVMSSDGKVEALVLDVGGFLGIGEKPVAVSTENLAFLTDKDGNHYLYTTFTKDQLEAQPAYDAASYATNRQNQLLKSTQ